MSRAKNIKQQHLFRRGFDLGKTPSTELLTELNPNYEHNWHSGKPIFLKQKHLKELSNYQESLNQSFQLYQAVLNEQACDALLDETPYADRLAKNFEPLGSSINEGDDQEIETVLFDATNNGSTIAEDLWMKVSWLSFYEEDASLRFRFSFGVDLHEDVAADQQRQHYAAILNDAVFPESSFITQNKALHTKLITLLQCDDINFVERIVYFNSPQGGAYLHHDRERGHAGVVYAQLSGSTFWLALTRETLVDEITTFVKTCQSISWPSNITQDMKTELEQLTSSPKNLIIELESFSNDTLIHLINETEGFVQQLINHGHSRTLTAGDILLLPQETEDHCCWHSVFTLDETSGEALSFAIRRN